MPELPEVETIRRQLDPILTGRTILESGSHWSEKFTPAREATGATFTGVDRKGKYLIMGLGDGREMIVHLGMTGGFRFRDGGNADEHVRAWWQLDSAQTLEFHDTRRFGRIRIVPAGDYRSAPTLHRQGPDPSDTEPELFWQATKASQRRIKTQLLSQIPIAGIGNIYADEALWRAEVHPGLRTLSRARADRLLVALQEVIEQGVANGGTTLRDYRGVDGDEGANQFQLDCYGRRGLPCTRCTAPLRSRVYDGRTTTYCPVCQHR